MKELQTLFEIGRNDRVIIGAQMLSPRFSFLDQQRMASMADEGGVSAAILDTQLEPICVETGEAQWGKGLKFLLGHRRALFSAAALGLGGLGLYWAQSRRSSSFDGALAPKGLSGSL